MSRERRPQPTIPGAGAGERTRAVHGVAWGGIESATAAAVGFVLTPLILRSSGIEGLGLWSASWSMAHTAGILDLGVGGSYARFTARAIAQGDAAALNAAVSAGAGFHLILSLIIAAAASLFAPAALARLAPGGVLASQAPVILACTLTVVLMRLVVSVYRGVVAGAQRIDLLGRIGAGTVLLEGSSGALILLTGGGLRGLALNSLACAALTSSLEGAAAHRLCPALRIRPWSAPREAWREVLTFGLKVQVTRAAELLGTHAPRLALALGPGLLAAGAYDLGARAAGALQVLGTLPLPVVQPLASRLEARGDRARLRTLVESATRYVAILVLPAAAILLLDGRAVLAAWTGREAPPESIQTACWLAGAACMTLLISPTRLALRGVGRPGLEAIASTAGSLTSLSLAVALAHPCGPAGVAAAALVGALVAAVVLDHGARTTGPRAGSIDPPWKMIGAPLLAAASALAGGACLHAAFGPVGPFDGRAAALRHLAPETLLMGGIFLGVAILLGGLRRDDFLLLEARRSDEPAAPETESGPDRATVAAGGRG
ncbi:MAG TPA: oligosaccharide flippase family protein [Candidatus Polarisedimenticolia bacterium]